MSETVKLLCSDGEQVEVEKEVAEKSVIIKGLIEDNPDEEIPLPNVKRPILDKIIDFCRYLKDHAAPEIDKPLKSVDMASVVDPWYADYINLE